MKRKILRLIFLSILICGNINFITMGKDVQITKKEHLDVKAAETLTLKNNKTKLTAERVKQIVMARVPGSTISDIKEFSAENETFVGNIVYNAVKYEFIMDAYTGRAIKWQQVN